MRRLMGFLLLGIVAGAPVTTSAAGVVATGIIDWSGFAFSTTPGLTLGFSDDTFGGLFGADVGDFADLEANGSIISPVAGLSPAGTFVTTTDGSATATAVLEPTALPGLGGTSGSVIAVGEAAAPTASPTDSVNVSAFRFLEVTASGSGTATFAVPFSLFADMSSTSSARAQIDATLGIGTLASPLGTVFISSGVVETLTSFSDGTDKVDTHIGVLALSLDLVDGDVVQLGASARVDMRNYEPVPVPGAIWLMLGGCGALVAIRRRTAA